MIFSIEKRRFRRDGKIEETRSYYLRYRIGDMPVDKWKSLGVTDKQVADQKAHQFIQEREREAAGILEPQAVRDSARKPLAAHLDDYVADLAARGRNGRGGRGARLVASRISPEDLFEQEIAEGAEIFFPLFPRRLSAKPWFHKSAPGRIRRTTPSVTFWN